LREQKKLFAIKVTRQKQVGARLLVIREPVNKRKTFTLLSKLQFTAFSLKMWYFLLLSISATKFKMNHFIGLSKKNNRSWMMFR